MIADSKMLGLINALVAMYEHNKPRTEPADRK